MLRWNNDVLLLTLMASFDSFVIRNPVFAYLKIVRNTKKSFSIGIIYKIALLFKTLLFFRKR